MPFRPPTFNLPCDIYRVNGAGGTYGVPDVQSQCNLSSGRRVMLATGPNPVASAFAPCEELLLPKGTDIRATWNLANADTVEVPRGSKRFYSVDAVVDIGKGWPNEYRLAYISYQKAGNNNLLGVNSAPVPLP